MQQSQERASELIFIDFERRAFYITLSTEDLLSVMGVPEKVTPDPYKKVKTTSFFNLLRVIIFFSEISAQNVLRKLRCSEVFGSSQLRKNITPACFCNRKSRSFLKLPMSLYFSSIFMLCFPAYSRVYLLDKSRVNIFGMLDGSVCLLESQPCFSFFS